MPFSCEACAAQSYEAYATRYDLAATARAIPPLASNRRFWFRRRKKRSYLEAASPMQVSCKPCAAQNYATNAPLRERAAIERAFQRHAPDRHVWPCAAERLQISLQGWNRAKLRNQGYASRPRCDRARIAIAPLQLKNPALSNSVCLF